MAKGNILKEAIADAKAVREVALANAKAALEEAFTPKLKNMLSAKLSEDLDEDMYYDEDEKDISLDVDELGMGEDDDINGLENINVDYENEIESDDDVIVDGEEDSMDEEIDLEEILNELESEDEDSEEEEEVLDEVKPVYKADDVQYTSDKAEDIHEEFDLDTLLEEINNLDKKTFKNKVPKINNTRRINNRINEKRNVGCKKLNTSFIKVKKELREAKKAFSAIKGELNEVNLLNSKLLYVNRIFKANNLDDPQKLRVVETLDKAGSIKEAKLIYETIKDSFIISKDNKKVKRIPRKTPIRENLGMASKAAGISRTRKTAPKRAVINESDSMVSRFQKLANIKINE